MQGRVPIDYFACYKCSKVWSEGSVTDNFGVRDFLI